jgi:hypothetical protein
MALWLVLVVCEYEVLLTQRHALFTGAHLTDQSCRVAPALQKLALEPIVHLLERENLRLQFAQCRLVCRHALRIYQQLRIVLLHTLCLLRKRRHLRTADGLLRKRPR